MTGQGRERRRRWSTVAWIGVACGCLLAGTGMAQDLQPDDLLEPDTSRVGQLVRQTYTSPIDGAALNYALWLPPRYNAPELAEKRWPLIVFLHGSGEGDHWMSPTKPHASIPVRGELNDLPFLVAFPTLRGSWSISALAERDVLDVLADVEATRRVDADRVHLVGLSMGGFAAWRIATRYPDRFASLVMFCGGGEPELAVNLRHVPVRLFHGDQDQSVPVARSRELAKALQEAGANVEYREVPGEGHVVWPGPLAARSLYDWLGAQRRVDQPRRVSFRCPSLRYADAYWVHVERLVDPGREGFVAALAPAGGKQVVVHAENVAQLRLTPPAEWFADGAMPTFALAPEGESPQPVDAVRVDDGWRLTLQASPSAAPADRPAKRPGLAGPIQDVLLDRFVTAVPAGTDGEPDAQWVAVANHVLGWRKRLLVEDLPVVLGRALTDELKASAHIIYLGDPSAESGWKEASARWPVQWREGRFYAGDRALSEHLAAAVFVQPSPWSADRYVVVALGEPGAVARAATFALTPLFLNPPPREDLLVLADDGSVVSWAGGWRLEDWAKLTFGAQLPARGLVLDDRWQLPPAALQRLVEFKPEPAPQAEPAPEP